MENHLHMLFSTVGSHALENLLPFLPKEKMQAIDKMDYAKVTQVVLGFNKWEGIPINAFGGLVPSAEKRRCAGYSFAGIVLKKPGTGKWSIAFCFLWEGIKKPEMFEYSDEKNKRNCRARSARHDGAR